jgi:WD40 repeat protein
MSLKASPGQAGSDSVADFSRDSRWLATTGNDDTVRVWDLNVAGKARNPDESDPIPRVFPGLSLPMRVVRFDPEGRRLITVAGDGVIRVWTLDNNELLKIAARTARRNLTRQEWNQYFPRQDYGRTFTEFPEPPLGAQKRGSAGPKSR